MDAMRIPMPALLEVHGERRGTSNLLVGGPRGGQRGEAASESKTRRVDQGGRKRAAGNATHDATQGNSKRLQMQGPRTESEAESLQNAGCKESNTQRSQRATLTMHNCREEASA